MTRLSTNHTLAKSTSGRTSYYSVVPLPPNKLLSCVRTNTNDNLLNNYFFVNAFSSIKLYRKYLIIC